MFDSCKAALLSAVLVAGSAHAQQTAAPLDGRQIFARCATCHSVAPGGDGVGPSLAGILNRPAASEPGFRYSRALKNSGITWDAATLDAYLTNPQQRVPGNHMAFSGIADPAERAALIDYLRHPATP
ncbi:MAG: c-type cytochrome [Janthinobacterium lividum]